MTLMFNATEICKAAGKRWFNYTQLDCAKSYKNKLKSKAGIPAFDLIRSKPGHNGGTMVQRRFIFIVIVNYL